MSGHNVPLDPHHYVYVRGSQVGLAGAVRGMWVGVSSTPGHALGCHVLLENGALVADLPLHVLAWEPPRFWPRRPSDVQAWDCFGWRCEIVSFPTLALSVHVLNASHKTTGNTGDYWFSLDFLGDGYSLEPEQHKLLHLIATDDGWLRLLPTDRLLWEDKSFTKVNGVPKIRRQTERWTVE